MLDRNLAPKPQKFTIMSIALKLFQASRASKFPEKLSKKFHAPETRPGAGYRCPGWLSGYGLEINPLHTLTIITKHCQRGKMIKPGFVTAHPQADDVQKEFETETINSKILLGAKHEQLKCFRSRLVRNGNAKSTSADYRIAGKKRDLAASRQRSYTKKRTSHVVVCSSPAPIKRYLSATIQGFSH